MKRALILIALAAGVSGCATIKGWFSDSKAENIEPPTALVEFPATINVQKVWSERVGKGAQHGARMSIAYADGKLYAASTTGDSKLDAPTATIWHKQIGERHGWVWHHGDNSVRWSGGPTVAATSSSSGRWKGRSTDSPRAMAPNAGLRSCLEVIVPQRRRGSWRARTNDGRVFGLDERDGKRLWVFRPCQRTDPEPARQFRAGDRHRRGYVGETTARSSRCAPPMAAKCGAADCDRRAA
jgi:outer membrane protein assembly factor BamB